MIDLDANATTPLLPEVLDAMLPWLRGGHANPSGSQRFVPQTLPGLIVLRLANLDKTTVLDTLRRAIPLIGQEPLAQHLWIVEETRIRIRGSEA